MDRAPKRPVRLMTDVPPWEDVLASFSDAVIVTDSSACVTLFNQAAEELTGIPVARVLGRACREVFAHLPVLAEMVERVFATEAGESRNDEQITLSGKSIPLRVTSLPIWNPEDQLRGTTLVIHDLSHQKRLEDSARRNESLARLGTMVAGLAHEIRNPLAGIKGAAQLLERKLPDPQLGEYTALISREANRLSALLEDLLTLGAPPKARLELVNIHKVIQHVLDVVAQELTRRGFLIGCEFDPSLPDIRGDQSQLVQVFLNLLKNAMDAMTTDISAAPAARRVILIRTRMETDFRILRESDASSQYLRVEIADEGTGIDPENLPRLFEPFFTTKAKGTGLGLAISHRIVVEHGGIIRAESNRPCGTLMTVTLPVAVS